LKECGHTFCDACIKNCLERNPSCPNCRVAVTGSNPNYSMRGMVEELQVSCPEWTHDDDDESGNKRKRGCDWEGPLKDLHGHENVCGFKMIACRVDGCGHTCKRRDMESHRSSVIGIMMHMELRHEKKMSDMELRCDLKMGGMDFRHKNEIKRMELRRINEMKGINGMELRHKKEMKGMELRCDNKMKRMESRCENNMKSMELRMKARDQKYEKKLKKKVKEVESNIDTKIETYEYSVRNTTSSSPPHWAPMTFGVGGGTQGYGNTGYSYGEYSGGYGGMGAGAQVFEFGRGTLDDVVLEYIKCNEANDDSGVHLDDIIVDVAASEGFFAGDIHHAVEYLSNEGHIHPTIDEHHYQMGAQGWSPVNDAVIQCIKTMAQTDCGVHINDIISQVLSHGFSAREVMSN